MSNDTVIKVDNLSKQYRIGAKEGYKTFRETLVDAAKAPFLRVQEAWSMAHRAWSKNKSSPLPAPGSLLSSSDDTIWALKDVSFEVKQGEVVGIIGRNGAGKSTLLKILSKITEPTEGRVELRGRVGSLLEVGTGFHPELTGHENVYLYGAILGMDRWEVTKKFDEIVAFAELDKFMDTPVKRYSSGMYMRLAFAVAAHMEPEILIVDEVLAVGDVEFQKKCLGTMHEVSGQGRTVLFVSHNMQAVKRLCQTGILLKEGRIDEHGHASSIVDSYLSSVHRYELTTDIPPEMHQVYPPGLEVYRVELLNRNEELTNNLLLSEPFTIRMLYKVHKPDKKYFVSVSFRTNDGVLIASASSIDGIESLDSAPGGAYCLDARMKNILNHGDYTIEIKVKSLQYLIDLIEGIPLVVTPVSVTSASPIRVGLVQLKVEWELIEI